MSGRLGHLVAFRLRGARSVRTLLAPLVALVAVELLGLSGPPAPAEVLVATAAGSALPVLGWTARQVLDSTPDEQLGLSALAVGGALRCAVAGLVAAYAVVAPLAVGCVGLALLHADGRGVPGTVAVSGLALALAVALLAVVVGTLASRAVCGGTAGTVLVLVGAPLLVVVLGLAPGRLARVLVPGIDQAARAAYDGHLSARAAGVVLQLLVWSLAVLALRLAVLRRG